MSKTKQKEEILVSSLSGDTTELLPFLPYLLQDFWELGSDPDEIIEIIDKYLKISSDTKILDLACGKGAVSVKVAQAFKVKVKGIDLTPEFIGYAEEKAREFNVDDHCEFLVNDINEAVKQEHGYDCVIFGAVGPDVLGGPEKTLAKLKSTVKQGGHILIEEGYIPEDGSREDIRYNRDSYFPEQFWMELFRKMDLELVETASGHSEGELDSKTGLEAITARAGELIEKYPDKRAIFEGYVRNQQNEYKDIEESLVCVTWVLRKK